MNERQPPSDGELEVLKTLWDGGPATVRGVDEALRRRGVQRAYTTVQTVLNRLQTKGHVASESQGGALVYRAASTRDDLLRDRLRDLADQLCEGEPTPLVLTLVEGNRFSAAEIARFRALLDQHRGDAPERLRVPAQSARRRTATCSGGSRKRPWSRPGWRLWPGPGGLGGPGSRRRPAMRSGWSSWSSSCSRRSSPGPGPASDRPTAPSPPTLAASPRSPRLRNPSPRLLPLRSNPRCPPDRSTSSCRSPRAAGRFGRRRPSPAAEWSPSIRRRLDRAEPGRVPPASEPAIPLAGGPARVDWRSLLLGGWLVGTIVVAARGVSADRPVPAGSRHATPAEPWLGTRSRPSARGSGSRRRLGCWSSLGCRLPCSGAWVAPGWSCPTRWTA